MAGGIQRRAIEDGRLEYHIKDRKSLYGLMWFRVYIQLIEQMRVDGLWVKDIDVDITLGRKEGFSSEVIQDLKKHGIGAYKCTCSLYGVEQRNVKSAIVKIWHPWAESFASYGVLPAALHIVFKRWGRLQGELYGVNDTGEEVR